MVLSPLKNQNHKTTKNNHRPLPIYLKECASILSGEGRSYEDLESLYTCKSSC